LVTPRFHFVHHSTNRSIANSNYGFIFSVWDRLFGTYTDPAVVPPDDSLGLGYEISSWRLVLGLPPPRASMKH
jgi:sterol desaturase/sphingolipid hydroxylase (fatty acid hydroxylase superfamily)